MTAIALGAVAALGWGIYDFLIRFVGPHGPRSAQAVFLILLFGAVTVCAAALVVGGPVSHPKDEFWLVAATGAMYAVALMFGYRAFAIGPVALVAPLIAGYPVFTMVWAVAAGSRPSPIELLGVALVLVGVVLVARFAAAQPSDVGQDTTTGTRREALLFSILACVGYASAFTMGQVASQTAAELSVTIYSRLWALAVALPITLAAGVTFVGARTWLPVYATMGALDGLCILAINAAGKMEGAEYAIVLASTFGIVTIVLAILFFRERLSILQCLGIACVFPGIVAISGRF
jgi:drug/metabolite transporter (DMT)-like permease